MNCLLTPVTRACHPSVITLGVACYTRASFSEPGACQLHTHQNGDGRQRWCYVCQAEKPTRTHHCTAAGRCVLRLDHWCAFANTSIGAHNHKFFLCWQLYQLLSAGFIARTALAALADCFHRLRLPSLTHAERPSHFLVVSLTLAAVGGACTFALPAWFFPGHVRRACLNVTAVEEKKWQSLWDQHHGAGQQKPCQFRLIDCQDYPHPFNTGSIYGNLQRVFGSQVLCWPLPVRPNLGPVVACRHGDEMLHAKWLQRIADQRKSS